MVEATLAVVMAKVAVVLPAGTVTLPGTVAEELLLDKATAIPPVGAAAFNVTVPVEEVPPATDAGFSETELRPAPAVTISAAVLLAPLYVAVIVAFVAEVTAAVVTVKFAVVLPAGTVKLAGTVAEELLLDRATAIPPVGAAALRVTVPVAELPPVTDAGFSETEFRASPEPAVTVSGVVMVTLL